MVKRTAPVDDRVADAAAILGGLARVDEPIGVRTTYRVGGTAALFVEIADESTLAQVVSAVSTSGVDVVVIGNGSNLLVSDAGFRGLCLTLGGSYAAISIDKERAAVEAGGGVDYPVLARQCASVGLRGMEWAVGIPGSVGGAVRMNAGGHGSDTAERLVSAHVVGLHDRSDRVLTPRELNLSYRASALCSSDLVLSATYFLDLGDAKEANEAIASIVRWRRDNQPGGRNAGSIFINPQGASAGELIDAAGLKGFRVGSASVSEKHANFIQADDAGSASDVRSLITEIQQIIHDRFGVALQTEVRFVGFTEAENG